MEGIMGECIDCGDCTEIGEAYCEDCKTGEEMETVADEAEESDGCTCWLGLCVKHNVVKIL